MPTTGWVLTKGSGEKRSEALTLHSGDICFDLIKVRASLVSTTQSISWYAVSTCASFLSMLRELVTSGAVGG